MSQCTSNKYAHIYGVYYIKIKYTFRVALMSFFCIFA